MCYDFVAKTPLKITAVTAAHHAPAPGLVTIVRTQDTKSVFWRLKKTFPLFFLSCDQIIPIVVDCRSG